MATSREIHCDACALDSLVRTEAVYEGFTKTGEVFICLNCGHRYEDEESTPFKAARQAPQVFSEEERPKAINIFEEAEKGIFCRYCEHYVVNPYLQRCSFHNKEVEATDTCFDFKEKEAEESEPAGDEPEEPSLNDLF